MSLVISLLVPKVHLGAWDCLHLEAVGILPLLPGCQVAILLAKSWEKVIKSTIK